MPGNRPRLKLPRLEGVRLAHFTLFAANPNAAFTVEDGVQCLIGANGLGKSTLLSAINFGFTGIVSEPSREFLSMEEYYEHSRRYSSGYFRGRISETDRSEAEISLCFQIGQQRYEICRGLFESEELRSFKVINTATGEAVLLTENETRRERQAVYEKQLMQDIGLASFAEFVFLQLFVFTFDERRITLFWNQKILERALYLAFGLDPNMAKRVDDLQRDYDSADSQVRNRQYDLTRTRKRVNELRASFQAASISQEEYGVLATRQEGLIEVHERELNSLEIIRNQIKDANLRLATLSARESALRDEYTTFFERNLERHPPIRQHPLIVQTLEDQRCGLCGSNGERVASIRAKLDSHQCPLCENVVVEEVHSIENLERLKSIDQEIAKARTDLRDVLKELDRLSPEEATANANVEMAKQALTSFDEENEATMQRMRHALASAQGVDALLMSLKVSWMS